MYGVAPRTSFALPVAAFASAPVDVWAVPVISAGAGPARRADIDASARTSIAANAMIPARMATRWVGSSNGVMVSSCGAHETRGANRDLSDEGIDDTFV